MRMNGVAKIGAVAGGYAFAFALAVVVVAVRSFAVRDADLQASAGMASFSDVVLFVAIFGFTALIPTAAALYFLRPFVLFWRGLAAVEIAVSITGVAAAILYAVSRNSADFGPLSFLATLCVLRVLAAPLFAAAFLGSALFSPHRLPRYACLLAAAIEVAISAYAAFVWFVPLIFQRTA